MHAALIVLGAMLVALGTSMSRRQARVVFVRIHEFTKATTRAAGPGSAWLNIVIMVGTVVFLLGAIGSSITAAV